MIKFNYKKFLSMFLFAGLKILGSFPYRGGVAKKNLFLNQNCLSKYSSNLCRYIGENQLHVVST